MKLYKKCTAKPFFFLFNDTPLASNNPLPFRWKLLQRMNYDFWIMNYDSW